MLMPDKFSKPNPEDELTPDLKGKALHVANFLDALSPDDRSLVLRQVGVLWQRRRGGESAPSAAQTFNAEGIELHNEELLECLQLVRIYGHLSKSGRRALMELAVEMDNTERFERLIESGDFEEDV